MAADIRPARASDVDALLAIEHAVFQTDRLSRRSFRRLIDRPSAALLVAEVGAALAGYCIVLFRTGSRTARLYSISTAPRMAGQGMGRMLIEAAEKAAIGRGKRSLRLEVREDNARAIAIYERAGFGMTGRTPDYYQDGTAAIRMEKELAVGTPSVSRAARGASASPSRRAGLTARRASP